MIPEEDRGPAWLRDYGGSIEADIQRMEAAQAAQEKLISDLSEKAAKWQDKAFIEAEARDRFFMGRPGEKLVIVLNDPEGAARDAGKAGPGAPATPAPWYDTLWSSVEAANACTFIAAFAPYVSSAFVPADSMPAGLSWVAEHQPVTPIADTIRELLLGMPVGNEALWAIGWCAAGLVAGRAGAAYLFARR